MMFELPFTLENIIFIPYNYLYNCFENKLKNNFICTLIHEKIHICQRYNMNLWFSYIKILDDNWILIDKNNKLYNLIKLLNSNLKFKIIKNPDTNYDHYYIYKKNNNLYYGVLILINNTINTKWFIIKNNELNEINYSVLEHEHPFEIFAYEISKKITNYKKS